MLMSVSKSSQPCQSLLGGEVEGVAKLLDCDTCEAGFGYLHSQLL